MRSWMRRMLLLACVATPPAFAQAQHPEPVQVPDSAGVIVEGDVIEQPTLAITDTDLVAMPAPAGDRFNFGAWANGGYTYNPSNPSSGFNGPYNSVYRANQGMFNQAYVFAEWLLPLDGSFGFGARVDGLWGSDYYLAQSTGFEKNQDGSFKWNSNQFYGFAIPQIYGQFGANDLNVKVGHFYTIIGYESVQATNNFFYSKSYSYQFGQPFTHWGALGFVQLNDNIQLQAGAHTGWDTLDTTADHVSFLGGIKYTSDFKDWWTSFAITSGQDPANPAGNPLVRNIFTNRTRYSFLVDLQLTENLEYVFHHYLGLQEQGSPNPDNQTAVWLGIDQYLYYKINEKWKAGGRFEWFRDDDGTRVGLTLPNNPNSAPLPGNYFSATVGLNYSPIPNLIVRPEVRWDFANDTVVAPFNDGTRNNQFMAGIDVILRY
jgi:hypothetical protein